MSKKTTHKKKGTATNAIVKGVARAPTLHPNLFSILVPQKMTINVDRPTMELKFPMNLFSRDNQQVSIFEHL